MAVVFSVQGHREITHVDDLSLIDILGLPQVPDLGAESLSETPGLQLYEG
jgi:hypothetical protein